MSDYVLLRYRGKVVGTAKCFTAGTSEPSRNLHGIPLSEYARDEEDLVVVYHVQIFAEHVTLPYPYKFGGSEAPPLCLGDFNLVGGHFKAFIAWDKKHLIPHDLGCDLADSPRNVSEKLFASTLNPPMLVGNNPSQRVRWHENVTERRNCATSKKSRHHETLTNDGSEDEGAEREGIFAVCRRGTGEEHDAAGEKPFSRLRKRLRQDTCASDEAIGRGSKSGQRNTDRDLEITPNDATDTEDELQHDSVTSNRSCLRVKSPKNANTTIPRKDDFRDHAGKTNAQGTHSEDMDSSTSTDSDDGLTDSEEDRNSVSDKSVEQKDCLQVMPFPKKRAYVYHTRKRGIRKGPSDLRRRRKTLSQRVDNPFLRKRLKCCKSYQCFDNIDPIFAFKTYRDIMQMNREDFKAFLIAMYHPEDRCFRFQGKKVCARYLQKGYGFSNDLQSSVKNTPCARAGPTARALPRDVNRVTKKDCIINFLRNYADEFGDMMPHALFTNLPDVARKVVYDKFKEHFLKHYQNDSPPSIAFFYSVWKSDCRDIRTRRNHGFSKCETCIFLKAEIAENQKHTAVVRRANEALQEHHDIVKEERRFYQNRCERAIRYPRKYISVVVDGADQKSFGVPHFQEKSKADKGHKLKVKCVGVLEHRSSKKLWLYAMTEEFLTGANHVIEVVHRTLTARKEEAGRLSEVLYVQVDNCTRENKNRYFLSYFEMLVALGVFLEVEISFLPVGHTHADIDQAFSSISNVLKRSDAATMTELISTLGICYKGLAKGVRLDKVANYSGLCEETKCLLSGRSLRGFTDFRFFRFTRATGSLRNVKQFKTQCHVKVQCRDEWQPLSLGPKKGFLKSIPDLGLTPHTETFPPDNVTEVNQCLASLHNRNRKAARRIIPQLETLRDEVYTKRFDPFHWNLEECFELNGNFVSDEDNDQSWIEEEHDQDAEDTIEYEPDSFVAIKPQGDVSCRFWIAMVLQVVDRSSSNKPRWLRVLWYSQKARKEDEFSARYVLSTVYDSRLKRHVPYEDQVEVDTVLVQFPSLNAHGYLRSNTRNALRQVVGLN